MNPAPHVTNGPVRRRTGLLFACWGAAAVAALAALPLILLLDLNPLFFPIFPLAAIGGVLMIWETRWGLYLLALSIGPMQVRPIEIGGITVNFPEVLALVLFAKEGLHFLMRGERPRDYLPLKSLGLFLAASIVGVLTGLWNGNGTVRTLQDFRQFTEFVFLYLLVLHRVSGRAQIIRLLACLVLGFSLLGVHGILQRFTAIDIPGMQQLSDAILFGQVRSGSFLGATPLGGLMVFCTGIALAIVLGTRNRLAQVVMCGIATIAVVAAVFTNTRASWLAIGLMLVYIFISIRKTPWIIAAALLATGVFSIFFGGQVIERMSQLRVTKAERSLYARINYYKTAWYIFRAHPMRGLGWGCYYDIKSIVKNKRYVEGRKPVSNSAKATVHSAYLQILVKGGLLTLGAFLVYLATWWGWVVREWWARPRDELDHNLFVGVSAALIGYLIHSAFENFFQWAVMAQTFWLLAALTTIMAANIVRHGRINGPRERPPG